MKHYTNNARWLQLFAPFRALSISAAYLTPFFLSKGMSQAEIFSLQSIFSLAYVLWEIPSGYIADRFGRAWSIKVSAPIASIAMIAYGFCEGFWQFALCELVLALANGLISGVDTALLYDSLKAEQREEEFVPISQRINAYGFGSVAVGVPVAMLLVSNFSLRSTLIADGILTALGAIVVFRLVEAPTHASEEAEAVAVWKSALNLLRNQRARWIIALGALLSTATYLAAWLAAPYYVQLGLPLWSFSVILAARSMYKAVLAHKFHSEHRLGSQFIGFVGLAALAYIAMASGTVWLIWAVLGHDTVQALHEPPLTKRLNEYIEPQLRATLNSVANLVRRLTFALSGPLVGYMVDRIGLSAGLGVLGVCFGILCSLALGKLVYLKVLR